MKEHEYKLTSDKSVWTGNADGHDKQYLIEFTTNNYQCYKDIYDVAARIMSDYQDKEERPAHPNCRPTPDGNGGFCCADEQNQAHHRDAAPSQNP